MCAMRCARCDYEFPDGDRFCGRCGLALSADGAQVDPLLGLTLDGRYKIERRIGAGGMGTVYLGAHVRMGQKVAIKVLHERCAQSPQFIQRFENEARTYGRLNHPNLVSLHDFGHTSDGTLYMVLEYCQGGALSTALKERGRFDAEEAVDVIVQVAQGLDAAHQCGVVHRDLKPANIMLVETRPGRYHARLLDFGIAKQLDDEGPGLTQAGMVFGTPEYMAPEQARGESVDARTDIYALGAILFELVTGRPPFTGANKMRVMHCNANEPPPAPSSLVPAGSVPPALEAVILRCLAKRADERYQSCTGLIEALEAADLSSASRVRGSARPPAIVSPAAGESGGSRPTRRAVTAGDSGPTMAGRSGGWTMPPPVERGVGASRAAIGAAVVLFVGAIGTAAWMGSAPHGDAPVTVAAVEAPPPGPAAPPSAVPAARVAAAPAPASEAPRVAVEKPEPAKKPAAEPAKRAVAGAGQPAAEPKKPVAETKKPEPKKEPVAPARPEAKPAVAAAPIEEDAPPDARLEDVPPAKAAPKAEAAKPAEGKADPLAGARRALKAGEFAEAERAVQAVLAKSPDDADAEALRKQIELARDGIARGRSALAKSDCIGARAALEPVLQVAPQASDARQILNQCSGQLPPRNL